MSTTRLALPSFADSPFQDIYSFLATLLQLASVPLQHLHSSCNLRGHSSCSRTYREVRLSPAVPHPRLT